MSHTGQLDGPARCLGQMADTLLPRTCIVCGRQLDTSEKHICLCCKADIPYTYYWERTRNPMADCYNERLQEHISRYEPYSMAAALFFYRSGSPYREMTRSLKYHSDIAAGRFFSEMLASRLAGSAIADGLDLVVPVPLHWTRKWRRGYNQAEIIADVLARKLGVPMVPDLLERVRRTRTQTKLSVKEKSSNVEGAFKVSEKRLSGLALRPLSILVVDDVFTTGATLSQCHRALRTALGRDVRISIATLGYVGE